MTGLELVRQDEREREKVAIHIGDANKDMKKRDNRKETTRRGCAFVSVL